MIGVTTAIVLDKRTTKKNGTFPVKLRVTFLREQKYYPLGKSLSNNDWEKVQSLKPRNEYKELQILFNSIEAKAARIVERMEVFSFSAFEQTFNQAPKKERDVLSTFQEVINQLDKEERTGTASNYSCALNSIVSFLKSKNRKKLKFSDVTVEWLQDYEKWMISSGNSITTVGIYARPLRAIYNIGIDNGLISREHYPFGKRKYIIPSGRNVKKALKLGQVQQIVEYQPATLAEERARDLWLFSYLCSGANVKDIAQLKYGNINNNTIIFIRAKTIRSTRKNLKSIVVPVLPQLSSIIKKWGQKQESPETYVFDILEDGLTAIEERKKIHQATKTIDKYTKRIGNKLGIDFPVTTYVARHSFATILKRSGSSIEYISESLGHSDIRTTGNYLDSFEQDTMVENHSQLLNFSQVK